MSIDDIILSNDRRGISALRAHLPEGCCEQAASLILENPGKIIIVTGFWIMRAKAPETDGPPGALAIGQALASIGREVVHVTDQYTAPILAAIAGPDAKIIDFPITNDEDSKHFADGLLADIQPSTIISIERCGMSDGGLYRNMRDQDMTPYNAKTDYLFYEQPNTIGIGDGGNEIGMGNLASVIPTVPSLVSFPCLTTTTSLIIASVSNWGGYGLVAALSMRVGRNLLPSVDSEQDLIKRAVNMGAVDGVLLKSAYSVDALPLKENSQALVDLHELLTQRGLNP